MHRVWRKNRKDPPTPDLSSFQIAAKISDQRRGLGGSNKPSQQSLATNSSFATANEIITPAASYFVDSSSDEETNEESLAYPTDPLDRILTQTESESTPTEIFISNLPSDQENMPSKKISSSKITPVSDFKAPVPEPVAEPSPVVATAPAEVVIESESAHFDVAQTAYGAYKDLWCWGKTLPVISNVLGLTEDATSKVLSAAIKMDLPSL
ncbi:hypothetical protein THAOC_05276, partial [Thalassiosira oceanica]